MCKVRDPKQNVQVILFQSYTVLFSLFEFSINL